MAERRMFAKSVIGSARFLRMPSSSRLLYYDLGMQADDDGVVEAFAVMRTTGATEDDLRVLASKGFVVVLNEDLVTFISDWGRNNQLRKDRYRQSIYHDLLVKINDNLDLATEWQPNGNQMEPEVSREEVSKGEIKGESKTLPAALSAPTEPKKGKPACQKYGEYGWVKLTAEEYRRLVDDLGELEVMRCIAYIDESAQTSGNRNRWKDWNLVIRRCHRDGWGKGNKKTPTARDDRIREVNEYYE